ncbi:phage holin family protein [Sodalis glossinidius]|uniref:phage holin family protein n=1 Tax=Sodalis glossinidius TaxID=63612 RepID=UPI0002E0A724|nr:phage holin family protein [Sodalis glossinidius]
MRNNPDNSNGKTYYRLCLHLGPCHVLLGAFSLSEWALITGIACTLATFLLNWIYRHKEYRFRTKRDQ